MNGAYRRCPIYLCFKKHEKKNNNPEFTFRFGIKPYPKVEEFLPNAHTFSPVPEFSMDKPLYGLKVAIDPGRIGGEYERAEEIYILTFSGSCYIYTTDFSWAVPG